MRFRVLTVVGLFLLIASSQLAFGNAITIGDVAFNTPAGCDPSLGDCYFTIDNFTGADSLPPDFPLAFPITFASATLTVTTSTGTKMFDVSGIAPGSTMPGTVVFGPPLFDTPPTIVSFSLDGTFDPTGITLSDGSTLTGHFSAPITNAVDGMSGEIMADTIPPGSAVPEPSTFILLASGLAGVWKLRKRDLK